MLELTALSYAHPPDLLALVAAVAVIALVAWPQIRRGRGKARNERSGRGVRPTASDINSEER